ncbi:MAG: hypothetical protein AAB267_01715 [Candidatus Desantisbacteria bacterium]
MNEVVIFCESYPQIKSALYLAVQNHDNHSVTVVIPGWQDLSKFFELVNKKVFHDTVNIIHFDIYPGRMAKAGSRIIKALYLLPDIVKERRYLKGIFNKHFAHFRGDDVFFFGSCHNPSTYYLLKSLVKTNRLVYMPEPFYDAVSIPKSTPTTLVELVHFLRYKLVYGHDMVLGKHPLGHKIPRMPDRFFKKGIARVINRKERNEMLQSFDISQLKVLNNDDYSIMYFPEDSVEHEYIADVVDFERRLTEIFNIMGKHFSENKVALKYHPGYGESATTLPFGTRLPDFIPAEFLYSESVEMYLGLSSMALANVEKGLAVSLIDMVSFKNETIKDRLKEILIAWSHSKIQFPKSLDEFERILIDIKGHKLEDVK